MATAPVILFVEQVLAAGASRWSGVLGGIAGPVVRCGDLLLGRLMLRPKSASNADRHGSALASAPPLSASVWVMLLWWSVIRYGYFEVDQIGLTSYLYAAVAGVAVAGFATLIAPPVARRPPWIGTVIATSLTALIVAANVPAPWMGSQPRAFPWRSPRRGTRLRGGVTVLTGIAVRTTCGAEGAE